MSNFSVEYPPNMLVGHKLALMGAAMLSEYIYYERASNKNNNNNRGANGPGGPDCGAPGPVSMAR